MEISRIETIRIGEFPDLIFVLVHTDGGVIGLGETWYAASTVEAAVHDHFGPLIIGRDPGEIPSNFTSMSFANRALRFQLQLRTQSTLPCSP